MVIEKGGNCKTFFVKGRDWGGKGEFACLTDKDYIQFSQKDHLGTDALLQGGWNLSEAEAEYGSDWLSK
jgi:hypothetical protein